MTISEETDKHVANSGAVTDGRYLSGPHPACGDVPCGIVIRMNRTAGLTYKNFAVPESESTAFVARPACPCGIHEFGSEPGAFGFVGRKALALTKAPAGDHSVSMLAPRTGPLPDSLQVLEPDDTESTPNGLADDGLRDVVIHPRDVAPLPAFQASKEPPGPSRAFALETGADAGVSSLDFLDLGSVDSPASGHGGDVCYSEINPERRASFLSWRLFVDDDVDEPILAGLDDGGTGWFLAGKRVALVLSELEGDMNATGNGGKRNRFITLTPSEDSLVIVDAGRPEFGDVFPALGGDLDGIGDSGDGPDRQVGRESCFLANAAVDGVLEFHLVGSLDGLGDFENDVAAFSERIGGAPKRIAGSGARQHQALNCTLHKLEYVTYMIGNQEGGGASSPRLKAGASALKIL